jgi:hypothetical protein
MDTDELIRALVADERRRVASVSSVWWGATGLAIALAGAIFFAEFGPRPDIAIEAGSPRVLFKFAVMIALAVSAFGLVRLLSRPGEPWRNAMPYLAVAPALAIIAVGAELFLVPSNMWSGRFLGANAIACLTFISLVGLGPLAVFLLALRHGAPERPALAGAVAGLLAGGIAGAFYAAHCTDDSPLFVATWYTIAVAGLALVGAAGAHRFARW